MRWIEVVYAGLMISSSLCAVCGNAVLLLLLLLDRSLHTETWTLTLSFSLSDLALALSTIPFGAHNSLFRPQGYASSSVVCQGSAFLFQLLQLASVHSLTWATIDKFTEICFALNYPQIFNAYRTSVILAVIWVYSILNASLPLLGFGSYNYSSGRFLCAIGFEPANIGFNLLFIVVGTIVPILTMCCMNGYIVYIARKQVRRGTFICNEHHCFYVPANNYFKSSIVMVTTTVCLLICWLPYITICFYETLTGNESPQPASAIATWLVLFTATLNPWINSMSQTRYRGALRRSLNKICQRGHKKSFSQSTETCEESHNWPSSVSSAPQALQPAHVDPEDELGES